ncbi:hypothetical protein [Microbispora bryophytorum]|uniref:hypothetical protein n=1 Tax=Microbispora bryophytorum TaxID=1460882 RepID=UPI00340A2F85
MSESYADRYAARARQARELLVRSSPGAARAVRARDAESRRRARESVAEERREMEPFRWDVIDELARRAIEARSRLVEASPPAEEPEVVDEEAERRRVSLARARMRARLERQQREAGENVGGPAAEQAGRRAG